MLFKVLLDAQGDVREVIHEWEDLEEAQVMEELTVLAANSILPKERHGRLISVTPIEESTH